ncbi:hypothetical protein, partial [Lachnoclostridium sp.]|uniref:hypothetical protein n=1 Tax=Lachnoclostridium sp. TaxID=2028282 RepID=UPI0028969182
MKKRIISFLLCALMVLQLLPIELMPNSSSIADAASTTAYSMASDSDIQSKAVGTTFDGTTWLQMSGSPTLTIIDNGGVKAISVTSRTSDWYCLDLKNLTTLSDGSNYTIKVTGRTAEDAKMKLSQT